MWYYFTSGLSLQEELSKWITAKSRLALTIIQKSSQKVIGSTSIGNLSVRDRRAEIGWTWLGKDYQGKGYNAEVKQELLHYLFDILNLERVELKTDVLNQPARKSLEKFGFVKEGVLRSHTQMIRNRRRDTIFYSLLKNEWDILSTNRN